MTEATITEPEPEAAPEDLTSKKRRSFRQRVEWVVIVVAAIISALVVKAFLIEAFYIPSGSMETTLETGDRVLVNKLSYKLHDVNRADVIVFERPPGVAGDAQIRDFIKRVIGLPGETIETRDGVVYINGKKLDESYLPKGTRTFPGIERQTIPAHHYWVMGDNRTNSADSRMFRSIDESAIIGRAFVQVWPPFSFELL